MPPKKRPKLNARRKNLSDEAEQLERNRVYNANRRSDEAFRAVERQIQNTQRGSAIREQRELLLNHIASVRSSPDHNSIVVVPPILDTSEWDRAVKAYETEIRNGPTEVCLSCGGLWFKRSVSPIDKYKLLDKGISQDLIDKVFYLPHDGNSTGTLCSTCRKDVCSGKVPKLCLANGLDFPPIPECLQGLTCLEERLVSPRIPFMQIRSLGAERQCSLKGSVVNVVVSVDTSVSVLPRNFSDTFTIQIRLKRKLAFDHHYQCETVRPVRIYNAARHLVDQPLYRQENVTLSVDWLENRPDVQDFVIDEADLLPQPEGANAEQEEEVDDVFVEPPMNPGEEETLVDTDINLELAPGEGQRPMPLFLDKHAEELSFPTIHCGQPRVPTERLTYNQVIKSEARRYDRRGARVDKLFFQSKCQDIKKFTSALNTCLRKKKGNCVTANQALNSDFVSGLVQHDDGFRILNTLRSSPAYWQQEKRKLMAMVRQFGIPTIFYTLSAAETRWAELLVILYKVVDGKDVSEEEALNADFMEKARLIRKDPITCARYFDHRVRCLMKTWKCASGPFAGHEIVDHYARVEFQHRGSPHIHAVVWLKDAPKYDADNPTSAAECEDFIDKLITCDSQTAGLQEFMPMQTHHHTRTCKIFAHGGRRCRFGLPLPPMARTRILTPFADQEVSEAEKESLKKQYQTITELLMTMVKENTCESVSFEAFLQKIQLTEEQYIRVLRSNLVQPKVYLKRSVKDVMVNAFNAKILSLHRANMDIQFILDPYACCSYIINYINKSGKGISRLLNAALQESLRGNESIRKRLQRVGNSFINGNEISAQEAAYNVMGMAVSRTSRAEVFINTAPPSERVGMLKTAAQLRALDPDSTEIFCAGLASHYAKRPDELEDACLAHVAGHYEYLSRGRARPQANDEQNEDLDDISEEELAETERPVATERPARLAMLKLKDNAGYLKKRRQCKIIRYRRYNLHAEPLEYFRENLMLYLPWRSEETELTDIDFEQKYNANKDTIVANRKLFNYFESDDIFDNALLHAEENEIRDEIEATQRAEVDPEFSAFALEVPDVDIMVEAGLAAPSDATAQSFNVPSLVSDEEFDELMRSLNAKQRAYIMHVVSLLKTGSEPFYHFVSGGAGVGKSRLIKTLHQALLRFYNSQPGTDPFQVKVLLCAPTGKAAYNIGGCTLHSAFRLPVNQGVNKPMACLDSNTLNTYTTKLSELKLVIVDEISMCGSNLFHHTQARLKQIFHTDRTLGGMPMIALGDFRQLPPVLDSWVFQPNKADALNSLVGPFIWEKFAYFELTEIMRQRDDVPFANALNHLATGSMTADDIALMNSRNFTKSEHLIPQDAIRLFRTNDEVDAYNNARLLNVDTETAQADSFDKVIGEGSEQAKAYLFNRIPNMNRSDFHGMPMRLQLRISIRYMLVMNFNTTDGLVNGAVGTLERIAYSRNTAGVRIPARLWIDFKDPNVGRETRRRFAHVIAQHGVSPLWTPIERVIRISNKRSSSNLQVQRTQFPLIAAEGLTVHKSQGSSYVQIALYTSTQMPRSALYVGCSRATSANGLYIVGPFKVPKPPTDKDLPNNEINRLKANPLIPKFAELLVQDDSQFTALFHNVQSLNRHLADIICDPTYLAVDLLLLAETWTLPSDSYDIPGYETIGRIDCSGSRTGFGVFCCVKSGKQHLVSNVQLIHSRSAHGHVEIVRFDFQAVTVCVVYNSPQAPASLTVAQLSQALDRAQRDVIVVADMNVNLMKTTNSAQERTLTAKGLASMLPADVVTTDGCTQIDWCFSNRPIRVRPYESLFSYHKPLHLAWNVDRSQDGSMAQHLLTLQETRVPQQVHTAGPVQRACPVAGPSARLPSVQSVQGPDQVCVVSEGSIHGSPMAMDIDEADSPTAMEVDEPDPSLVEVVRGSFHQGNPRLSYAGRQCTAIAACGIAMAFQLCPSRWHQGTIDTVLEDGDRLFAISEINLPRGEIHLAVSELCHLFEVNGVLTDITTGSVTENGILNPAHNLQSTAGDEFPDLITGVTRFLQRATAGILTAAGISVALGKTRNGRFWLLDSHSRDDHGFVSPDGKACLAKANDLNLLCEMFQRNALAGLNINGPIQYSLESVDEDNNDL